MFISVYKDEDLGAGWTSCVKIKHSPKYGLNDRLDIWKAKVNKGQLFPKKLPNWLIYVKNNQIVTKSDLRDKLMKYPQKSPGV